MGREHQPPESESLTLEQSTRETLEEARVVLPGIQALYGFQLIAAVNERFHQLAEREQLLHYIAMLLTVAAIALIMTPAAYHRVVQRNTVSRSFITLASVLIASAMVPLMLAIAIEIY